MRKLIYVFAFLVTQIVSGQNYYINFEGNGASSVVDQVKVENLSTGLSLILAGSDILHLTGSVGVSQLINNNSSDLKIYPNPMKVNAIVEIIAPTAGEAMISIFDITGRQVSQIQCYLENSRSEFMISGVKKGIYLINVAGNSYVFSGKLFCDNQNDGELKIEKVNIAEAPGKGKTTKKSFTQSQTIVEMPYTTDERLKFTAESGEFKTIKTDIPFQDKALSFNFIQCKDGDNYNYPVVEIGTQTWMAENLKTTKYSDISDIPLEEDATAWAALSSPGYCWYNNDKASNNPTYGVLYNWYAVNTGKLCPSGWHMPTNSEWGILTDFLGGTFEAGGKLKEVRLTHWIDPNFMATDETGFTGLPGGYRDHYGSYLEIGTLGLLWSSTEKDSSYAWSRFLSYIISEEDSYNTIKQNGLSVRFIQYDANIPLPTVTTIDISELTNTSAICGGNIISEGGSSVISRGVCWSTSQNPTLENIYTQDGNGPDAFISKITGLIDGTTYYVRAYAVNSAGTVFGDEKSFTTPSPRFEYTGDRYIITALDGTYTEPGIKAFEKNQEIPVSTSVQGTYTGYSGIIVNKDVADEYRVTYSATTSDGITATENRTVWLVTTGDLTNSIEGLYTSTVVRNGIESPFYSDMAYVMICKTGSNTYRISDAIGGYYDIGRAFGISYRAIASSITANDIPSNDFVCPTLFGVGEFGGLASMSGLTVDPVNKKISFTTDWDAGYTFEVTLTQVSP